MLSQFHSLSLWNIQLRDFNKGKLIKIKKYIYGGKISHPPNLTKHYDIRKNSTSLLEWYQISVKQVWRRLRIEPMGVDETIINLKRLRNIKNKLKINITKK